MRSEEHSIFDPLRAVCFEGIDIARRS